MLAELHLLNTFRQPLVAASFIFWILDMRML